VGSAAGALFVVCGLEIALFQSSHDALNKMDYPVGKNRSKGM
jgi:hypothetical protein